MKTTVFVTSLVLTSVAAAADWPMWGSGVTRNMVSPAKNPPTDFDPGKKKPGIDEVDLSTTKGLKWATRLGSQAYGTVTVSNGKVILGTNNDNPFDTKYQVKNKDTGKVTAEDRSVVLCLDEKTGKMIWQFASPKLGTGKVSDWEYLGICSGAAIEGTPGPLRQDRQRSRARGVQARGAAIRSLSSASISLAVRSQVKPVARWRPAARSRSRS